MLASRVQWLDQLVQRAFEIADAPGPISMVTLFSWILLAFYAMIWLPFLKIIMVLENLMTYLFSHFPF